MPTIPAYMQLMDDCAQYAVDCYIKGVANDLGLPCPDPTTHDLIPEGFRKELRMLAHRSVEAVQNPCENVGFTLTSKAYEATAQTNYLGTPYHTLLP